MLRKIKYFSDKPIHMSVVANGAMGEPVPSPGRLRGELTGIHVQERPVRERKRDFGTQ